MKKAMFFAAAAALLLAFTACKKDGVFNPKEKIAKLYKESSYISSYSYGEYSESDTNITPKHMIESWEWDGKTLKSVTEYDEEGTVDNKWTFEYDGKQLVKASSTDDDLMTFTYDGKKLQKIECFYGVELYMTYTFEYDGKKISAMTVVDKEGNKSPKATKMVDQMVLGNISDLKPVQKMMAEARRNSAAKDETMKIYFEWDGNNVKKLTNKESQEITITYDDKKSPISGFYTYIELADDIDAFCVFSENNPVTITVNSEEGMEYTMNFTYTYDGKWPLMRTQKEEYKEEGYYYSYSDILYYEYK